MRASSSAACRVCATPAVVAEAESATPLMLPAIAPLPVAASATLRFISEVVAPCSSTAEAMVSW
jgi:hypothetical protein